MTENLSELRNNEDQRKSFVTKKWNILIQKILHLISISVKCILWHIFNEIKDNEVSNRNKDDF